MLPVPSDMSTLNVVAYLFYCFFTISFIVFLSATQAFYLTDILGISHKIGNYVGTLGFADEVLTIAVSPLVGTLSDKIGTRPVSFFGALVIGISIMAYTTGKNVYPDLLCLRLFFALGACTSTAMMTATLAEITHSDFSWSSLLSKISARYERINEGESEEASLVLDNQDSATTSNNGTAAMVGVSSGLGAIFAVSVFLPLPAYLDKNGDNSSVALKNSYLIVGGIAIGISFFWLLLLKNDPTKSFLCWLKGDSKQLNDNIDDVDDELSPPSIVAADSHNYNYISLLKHGFTAAKEDEKILLSYIASFVARSNNVTVSVFIPLYVNLYFYKNGLCNVEVHDPASEIKKGCHDAYVLAAIITGILQTVSLFFAPFWGWFGSRYGKHNTLLISSLSGFIGSFGLAFVSDPHKPAAFVMAIFIGIGQIGVIISSMQLCTYKKQPFSGAIAGVYTLSGGFGILIITKVGGYLSDLWIGFAFLILATFNIILFFSTLSLSGKLQNSWNFIKFKGTPGEITLVD